MAKHQLELIERYLEHKMSTAEMAEFENALLHDPLLKNEVELQKDIINSIKSYRKTEIKARLDQINVNTVPQFGNLAKIAASVSITSMVIWGAFTYFNNETTDIVKIDIPDVQSTEMVEQLPDMPLVQLSDEPVEVMEETPRPPINIAQNTTLEREFYIPKVQVPDIMLNFEDTSPFIKDGDLDKATDANINTFDDAMSLEIKVQELPGRRNQFLYQNYEGKLYLYGRFSASPYELIELNTENGSRLFLQYDGSYYSIMPDQKDIVPLESISDSSLIKELNILKEARHQ